MQYAADGLSLIHILLQRVDMNPNLKGSLRLVYGNAQRLLLLVNQLMDLRKNQSGNLQLRVSHNDLYLFTPVSYTHLVARQDSILGV